MVIFAYITDGEGTDWQSSIDIVLRRFAEYQDLEGAFGRRAVTERAKGILMERHSVDEADAFEMLREHSRSTNRKLVDIASAVVDGHGSVPKKPSAARRPVRLSVRLPRAARDLGMAGVGWTCLALELGGRFPAPDTRSAWTRSEGAAHVLARARAIARPSRRSRRVGSARVVEAQVAAVGALVILFFLLLVHRLADRERSGWPGSCRSCLSSSSCSSRGSS